MKLRSSKRFVTAKHNLKIKIPLVYNNILNAGEGPIATMILLHVYGLSYLEARGTSQLIYAPARIVAFIFSLYHGIIYLPLLFAIWISGFFAGYLGAKISLNVHEKTLRKIFSVVALLIALKMLIDFCRSM